MKKIILSSLAALSVAANANAGAYVVGYVKANDSAGDLFDEARLDVAVGWSFQSGIRIEADVFTMNLWDGNENTDINFSPAFGNVGYVKGYYDFKNSGKFTPYVGAGLNIFGFQYAYNDDADTSVAALPMQGVLIGGISMALNNKMSVDLQYNLDFSYSWVRYASGNYSNSTFASGGSNTIKAGIAYKF